VSLRWVAAFTACAGCESYACPDATPAAAGITAEELSRVAAGTFEDIPLHWWDGEEDRVAVSLAPDRSTAHTRHQPDGDCADACCGPEVLAMSASAVLWSLDLRLSLAWWTADITGTGDSALWAAEPIGPVGFAGTLSLAEAAHLSPDVRETELRIALTGEEGETPSIDLWVQWESRDATGANAIGGPSTGDSGR
jgi:hypothetical protein